jgi:hypothetical protein
MIALDPEGNQVGEGKVKKIFGGGGWSGLRGVEKVLGK